MFCNNTINAVIHTALSTVKIINIDSIILNLKFFYILSYRDKALNEKIKVLNLKLKELFPEFINIYDNFLSNDRCFQTGFLDSFLLLITKLYQHRYLQEPYKHSA